jgi:hypothetical protein
VVDVKTPAIAGVFVLDGIGITKEHISPKRYWNNGNPKIRA